MREVRRLGRYEVGERLGSGGLGEVYLAHVEGARGFRKRVVIKQVRGDLAARPETAPLLRREAEVVQRLTHGNIVQVLDFGVDDGAPYLVMEHVDGVTLAQLAADRAALDVAAALFVVESVCAALEHAHTVLGLVHRDVTPSNILVSRDGVVKLTDFGIASLIATAGTIGTPGYAAPEQIAGEEVDARADVYALGVVLAELLEHRGGDDELRALARRAAAPERGRRFASAQEFAVALEAWRADHGVRRGPAGLADAVRALQDRRGRVAGSVEAALDRRQRPAVTAVLAPRRARRWPAAAIVLGLAGVAAGAWVWLAGDAPVAAGAANELPVPAPARSAIEVPAPTPTVLAVPVVPPTRSATTATERLPVRPARKEREPARGRLLINLIPWAQASVDGRDLGRTPIAVTLAPGRYTLTLANPDLGQRKTRQIAIAGGADTNITDW